MNRRLRHSTRLVADTVVGYLLLLAGCVMLLTPGPGIVTMVAGLAVLGRHYHWAHRMRGAVVRRIRDAGTAMRARVAGGHVRRLGDSEAPDPRREAA